MKINLNYKQTHVTIGRKKFPASLGTLLAEKKVCFQDLRRIFYEFQENEKIRFLRDYFNTIGEHHQMPKPGYYPSIRYNLRHFFEIETINPKSPKQHFFDWDTLGKLKTQTFLDIGSCNGEKLAAAKVMGYGQAIGIEVSKLSHNIAKRFFKGIESVELYNRDAFDCGDVINKADIVYTYKPINNHELMIKLYLHIIKNLKIGAKHIEVLPFYMYNMNFGNKHPNFRDSHSQITTKTNPNHVKLGGQTINIKNIRQKESCS
jgi:hypothetical protein